VVISIQTVAFWFIKLYSFKDTGWYHISYWPILGSDSFLPHTVLIDHLLYKEDIFLTHSLRSTRSKMLVTTYKTTQWHNSQNHNMENYSCYFAIIFAAKFYSNDTICANCLVYNNCVAICCSSNNYSPNLKLRNL